MPQPSAPETSAWAPTLRRSVRLFRAFRVEQTQPDVFYGELADDAERSVLANMMGDLHRQPRPRQLPLWRPGVGRTAGAQREDLERCLADDAWSGGPWSVPAGRLVADARSVLRTALRRYSLLGAAVAGHAARWVVTHGETVAGTLVRTPDGHRLVGGGLGGGGRRHAVSGHRRRPRPA